MSDPIRAALEQHRAHMVTGPFAVGETRWCVLIPSDRTAPYLTDYRRDHECRLSFDAGPSLQRGEMRPSDGSLVGPAFPNRTHALAALIDCRAAWLAEQQHELDALRVELAAATGETP